MKIALVLVLILLAMSCGKNQQPLLAQSQFASTAPAPSQGAPAPVQSAAALQLASFVIPAGTSIRVRIDQTLDTKHNRPGDRFGATLNAPVTADGGLVIPAGTPFTGHLTNAAHSGRFKGRAVIGLRLDSFTLKGENYRIDTSADTRVSGNHKKRNWALIGGGSGVGAGIGAIAGGGAGALIGAGAGAAAGTTTAFITGKKNVSVPAETIMTFRLREAVDIDEPR